MSCDPFACLKAWWFEDKDPRNPEVDAENLCAVYEAQVFAVEKEIAGASARARQAYASLKAAGSHKANDPVVTRRQAEVNAAAAKLVELRRKRDKFEARSSYFRKMKETVEEARHLRSTVGTVEALQKEMRTLRMGGLVDRANEIAEIGGEVNECIGEITTALDGMSEPPNAERDAALMAELMAELDAEFNTEATVRAPRSTVPENPPPPSISTRLPSRSDYATLLAAT